MKCSRPLVWRKRRTIQRKASPLDNGGCSSFGIGAINNPKLLLLDECAAGLDPLNVDKLISLVHYFKDELHITVLMIEHIMDVVMNVCEQLTVFDYGERIFVGKPAEAQNHPRVIEAYLGTQDEGGM